jgi:alkylhydroperoxidase family enzyme
MSPSSSSKRWNGPQGTIVLMHLRAGRIVSNTYLTIRHTTELRAAGEPEERITAVASWRDTPYFTGPARAALALVEAVLIGRPFPGRPPSEHWTNS